MTARLIVSLSGLSDDSPDALLRAAAFVAELDERGVPLSQLVRPRGPGGPLRAGSPLARWIHERRAAGDAVVLHGYDHTADPIGSWQPSGLPRVGRRAEFALLPRHEAGLRLVAARRVLAAAGLRTDVFVPPRWLASDGTLEALRAQGFAVLADERGVRSLAGAGHAVRARVLGFRASGERRTLRDDRRAADAWRCRMLESEVARAARGGGLVRINVRAKDLRHSSRRRAVLSAVDAAVALGAAPGTYRPLPAAVRVA